MATSCIICAHDNEFNRSVTDSNAFYFNSKIDIVRILDIEIDKNTKQKWIENNLQKLQTEYNLDTLINKYYKLFKV